MYIYFQNCGNGPVIQVGMMHRLQVIVQERRRRRRRRRQEAGRRREERAHAGRA